MPAGMKASGLALVVAALGVTACGDEVNTVPEQPREALDGDRALDEARRQTLRAAHLAVLQQGGRALLFSADLTVIKQRGRIVAWSSKDESFTARGGDGCYERYTDFNRADLRDARRAAAPPDVDGAELIERGGRRVVVAREEHMDFADTEFEVRLDDSGRPLSLRQRSARFGVLPPSRWSRTRYRFLTRAEFRRRAGAPPRPRCR